MLKERSHEVTIFYLKKIIKWCTLMGRLHDLKRNVEETETKLKKLYEEIAKKHKFVNDSARGLALNEDLLQSYVPTLEATKSMKERCSELLMGIEFDSAKSEKSFEKMKHLALKINTSYIHVDPQIYNTTPSTLRKLEPGLQPSKLLEEKPVNEVTQKIATNPISSFFRSFLKIEEYKQEENNEKTKLIP